jgi:hypothetical protein
LEEAHKKEELQHEEKRVIEENVHEEPKRIAHEEELCELG